MTERPIKPARRNGLGAQEYRVERDRQVRRNKAVYDSHLDRGDRSQCRRISQRISVEDHSQRSVRLAKDGPDRRDGKLVLRWMMRTPGVEPGPLAGQDPKSCASASSATFAYLQANDARCSSRDCMIGCEKRTTFPPGFMGVRVVGEGREGHAARRSRSRCLSERRRCHSSPLSEYFSPISRDVRRFFEQVGVDKPPTLFEVEQSKLIRPSRGDTTPRNGHLRPITVNLDGRLIDHIGGARSARRGPSSRARQSGAGPVSGGCLEASRSGPALQQFRR